MNLWDPLEKGASVETIVMREKDLARRYYRFRYARFYGGICTADAVGCNLLCNWGTRHCWNYNRNRNPATGNFFTPNQVADKLITIAKKHECEIFRISGCEPFIGPLSVEHYFQVLDQLRARLPRSHVVIETNGVYIGAHPEILDRFPMSHIKLRISLKGHDEALSQEVTGAKEAHQLQLAAIKAASTKVYRHLHTNVAIMDGIVDIMRLSLPINIGIEREQLM